MSEKLIQDIQKLKQEKNAIILAHNYQPGVIQELADFNGDSLELARKCLEISEETIVFCGVSFMAETAKIINPEKTVLLPEPSAGCRMADMADPVKLKEYRDAHPDTDVVCYINSTAEIKALSDVCVTSSNALDVVKKMNSKRVLFVPDQNLGGWIAEQLPETEFDLWPGYCYVHNDISEDHIKQARIDHPQAELIVHPECKIEISRLADKVLSTGKMRTYIANSSSKEFIIGTEEGMVYRLQKDNPEKSFFLLKPAMICDDMKKITLEKLYSALKETQYQVTVPEETAQKARKAVDRMLDLS